MSIVSIRISDSLLGEVDKRAISLHITRTEYIRSALEAMNKEARKQIVAKKLQEASQRVREVSMKINKEFSELNDDPET